MSGGVKKAAPAARTRIGKYEIGKTVGEGSFAKVKYARDIHTGHNFAIKVIPRDLVLRHELAEQIKREISTMKLIQRPNVLNLFEVMASKTKNNLVLEYVDGGELFDKIARQGRLSEDEARGYFQQLINAVDYCHSRGVYHRDLKPENLLLDSFGTLKVSDFGLSALSQQLRGDGLLHTACGTPNYVAPERMTIPEILESDWFKKGYKPPQFKQENSVNLEDIDAVFDDSEKHLVTVKKEKPESSNAFELISKSQGFSLENLFEKQMGLVKRETSFALKHPPNEIMSKIEEAAKPLGFNVHKRNYKMKLQGDKTGRKGHLSVATEVFEVAPSVHMVELRKTGGDTLEFHKFYKSFSSGLKDIVWTTEPNNEEKK